ncbi:hypothetical protein AWJ24_06425 [Escherichia coli]|uniref:helix-turn-helix transcriptional regulator n=1 Tax=Escherichia coli TaxID=562 RepID=UPI0009428DF4|nr:hypothetical protein AWJ24_06425 [Escherichia coli]OKV68517.1 hypothetical protein AWP57_15385 [Escherichia coli]OKW06835.1 hypothetical protein AWP68_08775 [Escherichia coli]
MSSQIKHSPGNPGRFSLSRSTIYEKLNPESRYYDETFPKPVRLGAASVGWRSTSVDEWIASRSV